MSRVKGSNSEGEGGLDRLRDRWNKGYADTGHGGGRRMTRRGGIVTVGPDLLANLKMSVCRSVVLAQRKW